MSTPFPGMDPYLEAAGIWEEVHTGLIVALQQYLTPLVRPRYRVAVERRTYLEMLGAPELKGKPDIVVAGPGGQLASAVRRSGTGVILAEIPMPDEVVERYLEIRDNETHEVVTVLELLSPTNKSDFTGRRQYERKRLAVLGTATHLVEIDLLRGGPPLPLRPQAAGVGLGMYRIVVSRSQERPLAEVRAFDLQEPIPSFPVPLRAGEDEPTVPCNQLLHELYDRSGFDLAVDYRLSPPPPDLNATDAQWVQRLLGPTQ